MDALPNLEFMRIDTKSSNIFLMLQSLYIKSGVGLFKSRISSLSY